MVCILALVGVVVVVVVAVDAVVYAVVYAVWPPRTAILSVKRCHSTNWPLLLLLLLLLEGSVTVLAP